MLNYTVEMSGSRIVVAHSPDSDDAFMFYGLASGSIDTEGIQIDQVLSDIETLNRAAFEGKYEVTAVSFHAFAHLSDRYALLPHGASMGDRYGPIVVAKRDDVTEVHGKTIAIPGTMTTAYLTLKLYEPEFHYVVVPFDRIEEFVLEGKADAGLLIHEGQLTYADNGLRKVVDLGEWWADRTGGLPLPLGGNVIRRDLGPEMITKVSTLLLCILLPISPRNSSQNGQIFCTETMMDFQRTHSVCIPFLVVVNDSDATVLRGRCNEHVKPC